MRSRPVPTGVERSFDIDEIIVSKTDPRGVITYANDVFLRVSAYQESDVLGQPHNIIRHPDMPRSVFALVWERLKAGEEIFGYVVNVASDGAHYWVLAHMTPTKTADGTITGFHSSRRVPAPGTVAAVEKVYRQLLGEERRHSNKQEAIAASRALLDRILQEQGMDYDSWVWSLEPAAVAA